MPVCYFKTVLCKLFEPQIKFRIPVYPVFIIPVMIGAQPHCQSVFVSQFPSCCAMQTMMFFNWSAPTQEALLFVTNDGFHFFLISSSMKSLMPANFSLFSADCNCLFESRSSG